MQLINVYLWLFFQWLLQTTVQASILIGLILLAQSLLRGRVAVRWLYCLWLLLLIRLIMPWAPQSNLSLFNLPRVLFATDLTELVPDRSAGLAASLSGAPRALETTLLTIAPLVWLAGAAALGCYVFIANLAFWNRVRFEPASTNVKICELLEECKARMGISKTIGIIETDSVSIPALFGFVRPRLLLPHRMVETLNPEELRHIFLHELAHIKRHDIFVGYVVSLLQILHWFNPLLWFAFYRMRAEGELACDELVLSTKGVDEPKEYGRTIIGLVERFYQKQHLPAMVGIMENKSQLKRRIAMIARFKKLSGKWSLLAVLIIALVATIALTNAKSSPDSAAGQAESPAPMFWATRHADRAEQSAPGADESQALGYGGYSGGGYGGDPGGGYGGGYGGIPPEESEEPNSPDDNSPENRP